MTHGVDNELDMSVQLNLYRIISELINNTIKHAKATSIDIILHEKNKKLTLMYKDDGIGFDYDQVKTTSYGLTNIQNRVDEINGKLKVETAENRGTLFNIEIQL